MDQGVQQGAVNSVPVHVQWERFFVEESTKFPPQFCFQFVQPTFVHDGAYHATLVEGWRDFAKFTEQRMKALANGGLDFLGFEIFLLLTGHAERSRFDSFHGLLRVAVNPKHEVGDHGGSVHASDFFEPEVANHALVDEGRVDVPVGDDHAPLGQVRADEGVGVVETVSGEQTCFLKRCLVPQFHGLQGQLPQLTVPTRLVGHHHIWERELAEEFAENTRGLALAGPVATLD